MSLITCPCHSSLTYRDCCQPFHVEDKLPKTALELMRSRYSAYSLRLVDYLINTTHKDKLRPSYKIKLQATIDQMEWVNLEILRTSMGDEEHKTGKVEFEATYLENENKEILREHSRFKKVNGKWFYYDGKG